MLTVSVLMFCVSTFQLQQDRLLRLTSSYPGANRSLTPRCRSFEEMLTGCDQNHTRFVPRKLAHRLTIKLPVAGLIGFYQQRHASLCLRKRQGKKIIATCRT